MRGSCLQLFRSVSIACCLFLAACGGDGGGGDDPFWDGLGTSGQIADTVSIGPSGLTLVGGGGAPKVTLDDVDRALAVWSDSNRDMVSSRDAGGGWETPAPINAARDVQGHSLRANSTGSAVLGWSGTQNDIQRIIRYSPLGGWDAAASDLPASYFYPLLDDAADLSTLSDDTVVISRQAAASVPDGRKGSSFRIFKHEISSGWSTVLETEPHRAGDAYLATNPDGDAFLFRVVGDTQPDNTWKYVLKLQSVDVVSGSSSAPFSFADGVYTPCHIPNSPVLAVNSPTQWKTLAFMESNADTGCILYLIRVDMPNLATQHQRMSSPGTWVYRLPQMAMNKAGDALAVWIESGSKRDRVRWAQSLQGGPWSNPGTLPLDSSLDQATGHFSDLVIAMNTDGRAVIALTATGTSDQYLVTGRFSFTAGWTHVRAVASMSSMTSPAVAINSSGKGLLVYGATPCDRLPSGGYTNCGSPEMYALRF